jgi:PhzF family phenazine biosynthesis protein
MEILRYAAFTSDPAGGNPAGVVLDAGPATVTDMQRIAADIGYSETAFLVPRSEVGDYDVRYFSPEAEVPFCGHATIAAAVAAADRFGTGRQTFRTVVGPVPVVTTTGDDGLTTATLTSVTPHTEQLPPAELDRLLTALRYRTDDLDPDLPPRVAYAGAYHPIIAVRDRATIDALDYDFAILRMHMAEREWTTVDVVWRESTTEFHARNPFPPGGVIEDPATGAAAAALGGYLRELGRLEVPTRFTVRQGEVMGRPGVITVDVPADPASGIDVTGTAVAIPA